MKVFGHIVVFTKASTSSPFKFSRYSNLFYSIIIVSACRSNQMYKYYTKLTKWNTVLLRKIIILGQ